MFDKANNEVLVQMMLQAAMPVIAQRLRESPRFAAVIQKIAAAELQATTMHQELLRKYAEIREELGDLLSENGLSFVLEDFAAAQAPKPATPVPAGQAAVSPPAPPEPTASMG